MSERRGYHQRYDIPGMVSCPWCSMDQVSMQVGVRCLCCGATVTSLRKVGTDAYRSVFLTRGDMR
jgi:hypothetical protein